MQIATNFAEELERLPIEHPVELSDLDIDGELTPRQRQRAINEVFGSPRKLIDCIDDEGRPQRRRMLDALKAWAARERIRIQVAEIKKIQAGAEVFQGLLLADNRGSRTWVRINSASNIPQVLSSISMSQGKKLWIVPSGEACSLLLNPEQEEHRKLLMSQFEILDQALPSKSFKPSVPLHYRKRQVHDSKLEPESHLGELETEAIAIFREAYASGRKACMLFSMGKDSMVMLRIAQKAFYPAPIPFPLVVIDTRWKFREMYMFRDYIESQQDLTVIVHINPEALERDINPFEFGSAIHTQITKTDALKQVLDQNKFEIIFGGARREEEKSRAKERIISVRSAGHIWDPRDQRPELWNIYNTSLSDSQTARVFPLSNWTEKDIWHYILVEEIPLVPLYFAKRRPFVIRNNALICVDDERMPIAEGERVQFDWIRFRTLGCYPLTGATRSMASSVPEILNELEATTTSERISRVIDFDIGASMEQKKREGYF